MSNHHDLIIIGGGPGGYVAAHRAAQLGLDTACVEKEPLLGGTCLRVGCIPSKALLESSERLLEAQSDLGAHGVRCTGVEFDLAAMLARKERIVRELAGGIEGLFKQRKVARHLGHGRLDGPGRVMVESAEGPRELTAQHIILATGSQPRMLAGVACDGKFIGTSTEALTYEAVPGHLVVIGAGAIGLELGSVWRRLGAKVTVLEFLDRILPEMDAELAADAMKLLARQGLEFRLGTRVTAAHIAGERAVVQCDGQPPIECDRVLVAIGRVPNTERLGLESVGLATDEGGRITVDDHFATNIPGVFAIGDVIRGPMLAHKAEAEARAAVEGIVRGYCHVNYDAIPNVVYTQPEIASVGRNEEQLRREGVAYRKGVSFFRSNGRARVLGHLDGRVKILSDARTDRILGVHIIGPRAGDLIAEAAVAIEFGASSEDLARASHAHPTLAEVIKEAALAVD
ncbi:MAG TPA: dihydrolipoyl dehydrogenase [Pirellulales bacterium]|nr:dihydrolipoyl dehydrogenase [Pirellulales bacterium]